jgi:hypothetical protein
MEAKSHGHTSDKEVANLPRKTHNKYGCFSLFQNLYMKEQCSGKTADDEGSE